MVVWCKGRGEAGGGADVRRKEEKRNECDGGVRCGMAEKWSTYLSGMDEWIDGWMNGWKMLAVEASELV